jgi:hypothetical protein
MPSVRAKSFQTFRGAISADDGSMGVITFSQKDGAEFSVALTPNQAMKLVDLAAFLATDCAKKSGSNPTERAGFKATWFEVGTAKNAEGFILSLTFGAGGQLSFQFGESMAHTVHEALGMMLGKSVPPTATPGTRAN